MKIFGIQCPKCGDIIYSRARHDFHSCNCGYCSIDGGQEEYGCRVLWQGSVIPEDEVRPEFVHFELDVTKEQLIQDWNQGADNFGHADVKNIKVLEKNADGKNEG